jgi:hypothetical protein
MVTTRSSSNVCVIVFARNDSYESAYERLLVLLYETGMHFVNTLQL